MLMVRTSKLIPQIESNRIFDISLCKAKDKPWTYFWLFFLNAIDISKNRIIQVIYVIGWPRLLVILGGWYFICHSSVCCGLSRFDKV